MRRGHFARGWYANTASFIRAAHSASPTSPKMSASASPRCCNGWWRHPVTGRKSLFLASHAGAIVGWPVPEARAFLRDLTEHATQRQFVYAHLWRQWDLVMWDNRVTMHRARPYDHTQVRDMHRTTVACEQSTMEQAA